MEESKASVENFTVNEFKKHSADLVKASDALYKYLAEIVSKISLMQVGLWEGGPKGCDAGDGNEYLKKMRKIVDDLGSAVIALNKAVKEPIIACDRIASLVERVSPQMSFWKIF